MKFWNLFKSEPPPPPPIFEETPSWIQEGVRVEVTQSAGFNKGAKGVVKFVQPRGTQTSKVWIIRDGASPPVWYWPRELKRED
jgi:hypothetical protein